MRRSKLEVYIAILKVLAYKGPLKVTHIMYKANVNCRVLKEIVEALVKQDLIEQRTDRKKGTCFAITQRGITVLKYFREVNLAFSIVEQTQPQTLIPY
jgi:predicted transcriptional regulator